MPSCVKKRACCALCSQNGVLQCPYCHNVNYCSEKHRLTDWNIIHHKICEFLKEIKNASGVLITEFERSQHRERMNGIKNHVAKICKEYSTKLLFKKNYGRAMPVILQEIRWIADIYDATSVEIIPTYCRLIEACLGLNRLSQAENYMSHTLWCFQKGETSCVVKFALFRVLAKISEAKRQFEDARDALAEHLYYGAEEWGPESIQTLWGYMRLGLSFLEKPATAYSFFSKVLRVEHLYISPVLTKYFDQKETDEFIETIEEEATGFSEQLEMLIVAKQYLETICCKYIKLEQVITLFFCLGALHHFCATNKASPYLQKAMEMSEKLIDREPIFTTSKKLYNLEQLRLRQWLRDKMSDAANWEGLPGTWHDVDQKGSTESFGDMMRYYHMVDNESQEVIADIQSLTDKLPPSPNTTEREAAGQDSVNVSTPEDLISDDVSSVGIPRSLSGSASSPVSVYYMSYFN